MVTFQHVLRSVVVATLFVVAGCGDDDGGGGGESVTKEEWLASAEAICADMSAQEDEIPEPQTVEEMADALDRVVEITGEGIDDLKALPAPEGDEEVVDEIVAAFEALNAAGVAFGDAVVEAGSLDEMTPDVEAAFRDLELAQQRAEETATEYGLTGCFAESND